MLINCTGAHVNGREVKNSQTASPAASIDYDSTLVGTLVDFIFATTLGLAAAELTGTFLINALLELIFVA